MSKKGFFSISIFCFVFFASNVYAKSSELDFKEGELLVKFAPKSDGKQKTVSEKDELLSKIKGGNVKHSFKLVPGLTLVQLPPDVNVKNALKEFKKSEDFIYFEPNYKFKVDNIDPNDDYFSYQWGLNNTGQTGGAIDADIDAPEAWDIITDSNIIVAVIDTGVNYGHPDLAENMWTDSNGLHGYDFVNDDGDPNDDHFHGTHVAGIIGATGNNGTGVSGVCWNAKIMSLKFMNADGIGDTNDAINSIEYAVQNGAKILNASWGSYDFSQSLKNTIDGADANGVLFIAASGNEGLDNNGEYHHYPASYNCNNIISVLATNDVNNIWYSSNYGLTSVDLGAPGEYIFSTTPIYPTPAMTGRIFIYYDVLSGTSMAAPYVSGACALVWAMNPSLTHYQVKDIILNNVDILPSLDGTGDGMKKCVTGGRLNLHKALLAAYVRPDLSNVDDVPTGIYVERGDYVTYTITYDYNKPGLCRDINNAVLIDYLPEQIAHYDINASNNGVYDSNSHTVTWNLGTLSHGDSNIFTLQVRIADAYESNSIAVNICKIMSDSNVYSTATENTPLGHGGRVLNMTWGIWYDTIQAAINDANDGDTIQVWPDTYEEDLNISNKSITLRSIDPNNWSVVESTVIYGSNYNPNFPCTPVLKSYKPFDDYNNVNVIISGLKITHGYEGVNFSSVSNYNMFAEIRNCIVEGNFSSGIYLSHSSCKIINCIVRSNGSGISCEYFPFTPRPVISKTIIEHNTGQGINISGCDPCILSCVIRDNGDIGIICSDSSDELIIQNNFIFNNGGSEYPQVILGSEQTGTIFRNNTLVSQIGKGIEVYSSNPKIINCIIWCATPLPDVGYNVSYSCVKGGYDGEGNKNEDPIFYDANANNYHLKPNSPCRDKGDANDIPENEKDIDGEDRIKYGNVDIGADEFYWSHSDIDRNSDVNFIDFAIFANDWTKSSDFNELCDIDFNDVINSNDLKLFSADWLWEAGWLNNWESESQFMMMQQSQGDSLQISQKSTNGIVVEKTERVSVPQKSKVTEEDIKKTIEWFEWLWDEGILKARLTEDQFNDFLKTIENTPR
jgi:hypothetical protein